MQTTEFKIPIKNIYQRFLKLQDFNRKAFIHLVNAKSRSRVVGYFTQAVVSWI